MYKSHKSMQHALALASTVQSKCQEIPVVHEIASGLLQGRDLSSVGPLRFQPRPLSRDALALTRNRPRPTPTPRNPRRTSGNRASAAQERGKGEGIGIRRDSPSKGQGTCLAGWLGSPPRPPSPSLARRASWLQVPRHWQQAAWQRVPWLAEVAVQVCLC